MDGLREFASRLVSFESTAGRESEAAAWVRERFEAFGFETYEWTADADVLAGHPSFPDDPSEIDTGGRPSVAGVVELGDPDAGPTVVLNGHVDVVPADASAWSSPPFEASWDGDELIARGAADMKSGLAACVFAARELADADGLDGRVVVECVVGEEEGGVGAASSTLDSPFPFERDAAIVAEPTELTPVVASEGSLMKRLTLRGRSSHAATPWRGESVLPHFERVREAFEELAAAREDRVTHPLYEAFPTKWPVVCGTVEAGEWASTVPASLTAEWRIGVAPGETVAGVEREFDEALAEVVAESEWLREHPPEFERHGFEDTEPRGVTYGADARHYIEAGIPAVIVGPGSIEQAHFPDETIDFREVETAVDVFADAVRAFFESECQR